MIQRALLMATSTLLACRLLHQTGAQYSAAAKTRAFVPARHQISETLGVAFPKFCLKQHGPCAPRVQLSCGLASLVDWELELLSCGTIILWRSGWQTLSAFKSRLTTFLFDKTRSYYMLVPRDIPCCTSFFPLLLILQVLLHCSLDLIWDVWAKQQPLVLKSNSCS